jgi:hypothetical protein
MLMLKFEMICTLNFGILLMFSLRILLILPNFEKMSIMIDLEILLIILNFEIIMKVSNFEIMLMLNFEIMLICESTPEFVPAARLRVNKYLIISVNTFLPDAASQLNLSCKLIL